ncbi:MAG: SNF2 helicase associated domain-containing protein, partial [Firmicutes bacterium]|nr:SNF2 helicase associated domain-containing protein [Bacillota bacterium]
PAFEEYGGICKHVIATVLAAQAQDSPEEMTTTRSDHKVPSTDYRAMEMLKAYAEELVGETLTPEAMLWVTLSQRGYRDDQLRLSFKIGVSRPYVIKDLGKLHTLFRNCAVESYGKQMPSLKHHPAAFRQECRPLLNFFLRYYDDKNKYLAEYGNCDKSEMALSPALLDAFFDAAGESGFSFNGKNIAGYIETAVRRENPRLRFELKRAEGGFLFMAEPLHALFGASGLYVLQGETFCACTPAYATAVKPLLQALLKTQSGKLKPEAARLFIADADMPAFSSSVLRRLEPYIELDSDEALEQFTPPPLAIKIYFDRRGENGAQARMEFSYGDTPKPAFQGKRVTHSYDIAGELRAEQSLMRYMGHDGDEAGALYFEDDPERLLNLAGRGIAELSEFAEIYASEAFKSVKIRPPVATGAGVKVSGGLLEFSFEAENVEPGELAEILGSYRQKRKYHRMRDGSFLALDDAALERFYDLAEGLELSDRQLALGRAELGLNRSLYLDESAKRSGLVRFERDKLFKEIIRDFREAENADYEAPQELKKILRNYQKTGYRWMRTLDRFRFGGILADDMGLGKTLQVLAVLLAEKQAGGTLPSIVVCPASLVLNWESECRKFTPQLRCLAIGGVNAERAVQIETIGQYDLIVTSYDALKRDITLYEPFEFRFAVIDEAQYIKNQNTQNAKSVKTLRGQTRLALTGTPIENSLAELWSIFDFLMPGYLHNYSHFRKKYERPIVKEQSTQATERLRALVRPFILRRMKADVLRELPSKTESVLRISMVPAQKKLYLAALAQTRSDLMEKLTGVEEAQGRMMVLAALTRLRQLCCDPALVYENYRDGSAKTEGCLELIESSLESGHRLLLFSQFTSM